MLHAQKVGNAVDDNTRLARSRAGKNQAVAAALVGNDGFLHLIQPVCNFAQGLWRCGFVQFFQTAFKPFVFKTLLLQTKVIAHQTQPFGKVFQGAQGIFLHHVDLKAFFAVKYRKRPIIFFEVLAFGRERVGIGDDGHGMAQDGHAVVEGDDALFVHEQQGLFDQGFAAAGRDEHREFHVAGQPVCQLAHACFNRDVFLVQAVGFGNKQRQQAGGGLPAQLGVILHTLPAVAAVFEAYFQNVVTRIADLEAAAAVCALHCFVV